MTDRTKTQKTEKVFGLFDAVRVGSGLVGNMAWETPFVILRHLKSGKEYRYQSDKVEHTYCQGFRYAIIMRVRDDRVWRMYECERWDPQEVA